MGRPTYFLDLDAVVFASFCHYKLIQDCYHGFKKDLHRTLISALLLQSVVSFLFIMADILVFMLSLAWTVLSTISASLENSTFEVVFPDEAALNQMASTIALVFAPGLLQVLQSTVPPTIEYLKALPSCDRLDRVWAVYLLVLEKPGHKSKIYVGSGTNPQMGVWRRMQCYVSEYCLPYYAKKALDDGYHISHKGLLCKSSIPARPLQPTVRTFLILLEAAFAFVFWAMYATKGGYGMSSICPWDRASLEYSGLCSHCCLNEQVPGEWGFWDEELEVLANLRKAQRSESNQDSVDRLRTAKKYWCDLCKVSKASKYKLDQHNATPSHLRKLADMVDPKKPHKRVPCNMSFADTGHLYRHNKTMKHKATVSKTLRRRS